MSGLFSQLSGAQTNGAAHPITPPVTPPPVPPSPSAPAPVSNVTGGLFGAMTAPALPSAPTAPPAPPQSDAERAAAIAAERARLEAEDAVPAVPAVPAMPVRHPLEGLAGYTVGQPCNGRGWYVSSDGSGHIVAERGHACSACAKPNGVPNIAAVNPPDAPGVDPLAAADPLPPEVIATIQDPVLKNKAEAHALAHARKREADAAASGKAAPKTAGRCEAGGKTYALTRDQAGKKRMKCPSCGKEMKIKPSDDFESTVMPAHNMPKAEADASKASVIPNETSYDYPPGIVAQATKEFVESVSQALSNAVETPLPSIPPLPAIPSIDRTTLGIVNANGQPVPVTCSRCEQLERENTALRNTVHALTAAK